MPIPISDPIFDLICDKHEISFKHISSGQTLSPQVLGQDAATSQLIKRPRHEANWTCRGYRGAVLLKLLCRPQCDVLLTHLP